MPLVERIAIQLRQILGITMPPPPPKFWEASPARYAWHRIGSEPIHFQIEISTIKLDSWGVFSVEMNIDHAGIRVGSVATYAEGGDLVIYLGNHFYVPEQLKRRGLAACLLAALVDSFQIAVLGTTGPEIPVALEGFFINEGILFATAMCNGTRPAKGSPAQIEQSRLSRGRHNLTLLAPPVKQEIFWD